MSDNVRRLPVYLLVDCSGSMTGDPIESVKSGIRTVHDELMIDPHAIETAWLSVITFSDSASQAVPLTMLKAFSPPDLVAGGRTALGAGLNLLMDCINSEVRLRNTEDDKADWKPLIFLMTDGNPTDPEAEWQEAIAKLKSKRPGNIIAVACGDAADVGILKSITEDVLVMKTATAKDFSDFFNWVTRSITKVSAKAESSGDVAESGIASLPPPPSGFTMP